MIFDRRSFLGSELIVHVKPNNTKKADYVYHFSAGSSLQWLTPEQNRRRETTALLFTQSQAILGPYMDSTAGLSGTVYL
ncbi:MAG: hypothetical protein IPN36_06885 [Bacteroidetes bacterium]|nr:hypothetical protein [Bacteroidota bacterium]